MEKEGSLLTDEDKDNLAKVSLREKEGSLLTDEDKDNLAKVSLREKEGRLLTDEGKDNLAEVALMEKEGTDEYDTTGIVPRYFTRPPTPSGYGQQVALPGDS